PPYRFVDEMRRGPYRYWRHLHTFQEQDGGTNVIDQVDYGVPGGALVNWLLVRRDLQQIFTFRCETLKQRFGGTNSTADSEHG
ncbi:MAG: hypothetical protein KDA75_22350, partial [Planctomycetaceae bacterium]|nr:hypothetical protein [Planctomycetaceae bacterium]